MGKARETYTPGGRQTYTPGGTQAPQLPTGADINKALSGTGSANPYVPLNPSSSIYMGSGPPALTGGGRDVAHGITTPQTLTYQDARLLPTTWSAQQLKQFVNKGILYKMPGFNSNMGMPDIVSAWDDMVKASYEWNLSTDPNARKWTPQDVMDSYASQKGQYGTIKSGEWLIDAATGEKVKYLGPTSKTTTSRSVNLSSAEDVQALTTQVLTQALGRAPTSKEVAQYKSTLNAQERANPSVTTTTSQLAPNLAAGTVDTTSQSSVTTGGMSAAAEQQMVLDQAQQTQEYAKYQGGTTYYNAMMQLLAGG